MSTRAVVADVYRGALPALLVSALGGLLAGSILGRMNAELEAIQGLLVLVPAFLAIRGSVYGSLGSRLSSALHQGLLEPAFAYDGRLASATAAAILNGLTASLFAAVLAYVVLTALGLAVAPLRLLVVVALVGALLAGAALSTTILVVVFLGYRNGVNPDDLVGPTMTTAGDVFGMAALFVATRVALAVA